DGQEAFVVAAFQRQREDHEEEISVLGPPIEEGEQQFVGRLLVLPLRAKYGQVPIRHIIVLGLPTIADFLEQLLRVVKVLGLRLEVSHPSLDLQVKELILPDELD